MSTPVVGQSLNGRLAELDEKRQDGSFEEALEGLQALNEAYSDNADVLWRLARVKSDVGEEVERDSERRRLFLDAVELAERAVELEPENAQAHLSLAIVAGRAGLVSGTRDKVRYSRVVKDHAERAIELDPDNDLAYHVRGRWHHEVASLGRIARIMVRTVYGGLPNASYEQAREDFQTAIAIQDRVAHRVELGRTLRELGDTEGAREQFRKAIELPSKDPHDLSRKQTAHRIMQRL